MYGKKMWWRGSHTRDCNAISEASLAPKADKGVCEGRRWQNKPRKNKSSKSGGCPPSVSAGFVLHLCRIKYMDLGQEIHSYGFIEQSSSEEKGC